MINRLSLSLLGGLLLALSFIYPQAYVLAWLAFTPLIVAINKLNYRQTYWISLVFGFVAYSLATFWIADFFQQLKGYTDWEAYLRGCFFWLYSAHLIVFVALSYQWLSRNTTLSPLILFPACLTFFFNFFPSIFPLPISASQIQFTAAIQAVSITGMLGLDGLIGLINIVIASIILRTINIHHLAFTTAIFTCWLGYGFLSKMDWEEKKPTESKNRFLKNNTLKIGIVQPNQSVLTNNTVQAAGFSRSYPKEIAMTEKLAMAGAAIVIWPEVSYKGFYDDLQTTAAFKKHIQSLGIHLIFPDIQFTAPNHKNKLADTKEDTIIQHKMTLLSPLGEIIGQHSKSKLIPFGETLPFGKFSPPFIRDYFSGILDEMTPGKETPLFNLLDNPFNLLITPLICYESLFPQFVADATPLTKSSRLIITSSNNNWFGNTLQPFQYERASAFRAIENHATMIHVMNNGPSSVYLPNGERIFATPIGEAGGYLFEVPILAPSQPPFYSRYAGSIHRSLALMMLCLLLIGLFNRFNKTI